MTNNIHSSAVIEQSVQLGKNITIGPFCYVSGNVKIDDNTILKSHVVISGNTKIGKNNIFFPFANIGDLPQDLKFSGESSSLEIGNNNIFRENVTIHTGTELGNKYHNLYNVTKIGDNCLFMVGSHIAHDCVVGNKVILANNATLAGHVSVGNNVVMGGLSAALQFIRIGDYAIIGGMSGIESDVLPYALVMGERAYIAGINLIGLKRNNFSKPKIASIKAAYDVLFAENSLNFKEKVKQLKEQANISAEINLLTDFIESAATKAILKPKKTPK